jgi:restriction endonuclease S subunit
MISKQSLESLEVDIPSLARQHLIVEMAALTEEEQRIMKKLAEKRMQYISKTLLQIAQGD